VDSGTKNKKIKIPGRNSPCKGPFHRGHRKMPYGGRLAKGQEPHVKGGERKKEREGVTTRTAGKSSFGGKQKWDAELTGTQLGGRNPKGKIGRSESYIPQLLKSQSNIQTKNRQTQSNIVVEKPQSWGLWGGEAKEKKKNRPKVNLESRM